MASRAPLVILLAIAVQPLLWLAPSDSPSHAAEGVTLGGPFELIDQNGETRTDVYFQGRYLLISFGFTYCPDTCPTTLSVISEALDAFAERAPARASRVVPVFVTVDPMRDTAPVLKNYLANFHPRLVGLTGRPEQIERMAKQYGAFYAPVPTGVPNDYLMDHSAFILLMGPQGDYLTHFDHGADVQEIVDELSRWIAD